MIRISVAHSAAWVHEWSTQRLHKVFSLIILAHVLFIWAGDIYMVIYINMIWLPTFWKFCSAKITCPECQIRAAQYFISLCLSVCFSYPNNTDIIHIQKYYDIWISIMFWRWKMMLKEKLSLSQVDPSQAWWFIPKWLWIEVEEKYCVNASHVVIFGSVKEPNESLCVCVCLSVCLSVWTKRRRGREDRDLLR